MRTAEQVKMEEFQVFLDSLILNSAKLKLRYIENDKKLLGAMFPALERMKFKKDSYFQKNALNFNVFSILRYGHYETRLHTPFLVNLLAPNGSHELGGILFLKFINKIFGCNWLLEQIEDVSIVEELQSDQLDGRIDIFIKFKLENEWYFIAVENKINAIDQGLQLSRYYDYLLTHTTNLKAIKLVYLTKDGRDPEDERTISINLLDELKSNSIYIPLSHRNDIVDLIESSITSTTAIRVKETLLQYLFILKNI